MFGFLLALHSFTSSTLAQCTVPTITTTRIPNSESTAKPTSESVEPTVELTRSPTAISTVKPTSEATVASNAVITAKVKLGSAAGFVILSKAGITDVSTSRVVGNIGSSPITGAAILVPCSEIVGQVYTVDAAGPLPCSIINPSLLTSAVSDMMTAYNDAAGRVNPDFLNLGAGTIIAGTTLTPGLYKWTSFLFISGDITISGSSTDVWIFQISGGLAVPSDIKITLAGGASAANIYWQVSGAAAIGTNTQFEGIILCKTNVNLLTGASINGKVFSQTAVNLQMNTVVNV